jgi:hypothetical protein
MNCICVSLCGLINQLVDGERLDDLMQLVQKVISLGGAPVTIGETRSYNPLVEGN